MKKKLTTSIICLLLNFPAYSSNTVPNNHTNWWSPSRLYIGAYGGYGNVSGAYKNDGQMAQGRLGLGLHAAEYRAVTLGAEVGVESGNDMRLQADTALMDSTGGLPIQSTLKPLLDLLITVQGRFSENYPVIGILKGGIAYRQLQLEDRTSSRDELRKINPELQLGLGTNITQNVILTAFYQGIYSGSTAGVSLNSVGDATISHIPTQQAVFVGIECSFDNH